MLFLELYNVHRLAALLAALLALLFGGYAVARLLKIRYTLAEFYVLVLLTGLGIGLTAKAFPADTDIFLVSALSLLSGGLLLWGGAEGLTIVHWLEVAGRRRRLFILLGGMVLPYAVLGVLTGASAGIVGGVVAAREDISGLMVVLWAMGMAAPCLFVALPMFRLSRRAKEVERRERKRLEEEKRRERYEREAEEILFIADEHRREREEREAAAEEAPRPAGGEGEEPPGESSPESADREA